ncbi:PTS transporter subunit EIIC [Ligilactobacillus sp. Marseille-Q7487]|uniref:PTS sugar transporter subunit IIC n=1 Tax=Ligilactobacillus sp. Marseille-Q7487 TaxID=3022128 RepID=UPI0024A9E3F0|nr:PTS transporter subunit EIIC [Ligilactobacillus sp. Marseille-Q7487]
MQNGLLAKLDKVLSPIGVKLGNQRHLQAIANGMMFGLPFLVIGSFFLIFANPPINLDRYNPETANFFMHFMASWKDFAVANYDAITLPYNMTMGIYGIVCAFGIGHELSKTYERNAPMDGMMALIIFMMVATDVKDNKLAMDYLGTNGLFVAILIGLLSVELNRLVDRDGLKINMPSTVPPMVTTFINSLIPLTVNILVFYGANLLIHSWTHASFPEFITKLLTPATSIATNLWGFILIVTIGNFLWLIGVNGTSIVFPILFALGVSQSGMNADLINHGQAASHLINLQMFRISVLGGAGNTLGLVLLMMFSRVEKFRSIGRLSFIPGMCSINEPVIFGSPIVFNPILGIPFILAPIVNLLLTYGAQKIGLISLGYIVDPSFTPFFAQAYMSTMDWRNVVFWIALIFVAMVIYLPFFKVCEHNEKMQEQAM